MEHAFTLYAFYSPPVYCSFFRVLARPTFILSCHFFPLPPRFSPSLQAVNPSMNLPVKSQNSKIIELYRGRRSLMVQLGARIQEDITISYDIAIFLQFHARVRSYSILHDVPHRKHFIAYSNFPHRHTIITAITKPDISNSNPSVSIVHSCHRINYGNVLLPITITINLH